MAGGARLWFDRFWAFRRTPSSNSHAGVFHPNSEVADASQPISRNILLASLEVVDWGSGDSPAFIEWHREAHALSPY